MFARIIVGALALLAISTLPAASAPRTLATFHSDAEIKKYLERIARHRQPLPPPAPPPAMVSGSVETTVVTAEKRSQDVQTVPLATTVITNNQEANVDEGDIVKLHGDVLVVLHRGRLFTVSITGLRAVDSLDAFPPGVNASGDWYDEMLIAGDRIAVIGYSYTRGGTQINRFHIDTKGHLKFQDAYQLRSNDYYSSRNYASRLIGTKLIFYTPRYLPYPSDQLFEAFPALRKWSGNETPVNRNNEGFVRISSAQRVYYARQLADLDVDTIHSVTVCDVAAPTMSCKATSVLGPAGRVFYVSQHAVYVWVSPEWGGSGAGIVYRMPLDGNAPSAIGVRGGPVDQFSFREDPDALNVLIRAEGKGDAMWAGERSDGAVGLVRIPLSAFGDGTEAVRARQYRRLPTPKEGGDFHNRFVGNYVLYGEGNDYVPTGSRPATLYAARLGGGVSRILLGHPIDRIEVMGNDAVAVGSDEKNLYFSAIALADVPRLSDSYAMKEASESETRSHAFFFTTQRDSDGGYSGRNGILGLPVAHAAQPAYAQLFETSAGVLYVRRSDGRFSPLGTLDSHPEGAVRDGCVASCVDWYGNARPIFIGSRAFALMGYELVEGRLSKNAIREVARVNFAPPAATD